MSLVAYGSSDESDEEYEESSDIKSEPKIESNRTEINKPDSFASKQLPVKETTPGINESTTKKESNSAEKPNGFFSSIPPPKAQVKIQRDDNLDELPVKKATVKISVPSLSEFKDDESEPTKKKLKPSAKGSGLFALLPAPRNVFMKETKSEDGTKTQAPLIPRAVTKPPRVIPERFLKPTEDTVKEDKEESLDFFSLGSLNDVPEEVSVDPMEELSGSTRSSLNLPPPRWNLPEPESSEPSAASTDEEPSSSNLQEENFIPLDDNHIQLSEEALQKLCGRKDRQQHQVEVIDVSGAELLPDPKEWLTKQLTEEKALPSRGFGRRHDGPTSQQRRKHQITYLAFQAKENELELKNQWSQNRMSRKQTQSKYGF